MMMMTFIAMTIFMAKTDMIYDHVDYDDDGGEFDDNDHENNDDAGDGNVICDELLQNTDF